jgi:hypothetical protein
MLNLKQTFRGGEEMIGKLRLSILAALMAVAVAGSAQLVGQPSKAEAGLATGIRVINQTCTGDGFVRINLAWNAPNEGAQYVDVSLSNNGWWPGTFIGIGPFGAYDGTGVWAGLEPGKQHFLRINNLMWWGWTPSQTIAFNTRGDCGFGVSTVPIQTLTQIGFHPQVISQECLPDGRVRVFFNMDRGAVSPGFGQYIPNTVFADISLVSPTFVPGTFVNYGQVSPAQAGFWWEGLMPGRTHWFRLNGLGQFGWIPTQPVSFVTLAC